MERRFDINKIRNSSKIRNGHVLKGYFEVTSPIEDGALLEPQYYWIRSRSNRGRLLDNVVTCEDRDLNIHEFQMLDILEGRAKNIIFEGVYKPSELGRNVIDPRQRKLLLAGYK